ncbi:hypothetical protein GWK47_046378 [Chionoecetes opilio]|uniref:Uncharacterized protein n=1 Tax=Chionoecetes opilio TaxID=41210 RepID=A0A8J5CUW0_CHIOP|nr:hypothetical protein GWK47_046378 [Chionoecetes opilio]
MSCSCEGVERWSQVNSPCEDCLFISIALRANYQAAIWRGSLQSQPFVPNPTDCGWMTDEDGKLAVNWMRGSPANPMLLCSYCPASVCGHANPLSALAQQWPEVYGHGRLQTCQNKAIEEEPVANSQIPSLT